MNSQNKVIHRFVQPISEYEIDGKYYNRIIPIDTQAYAYYTLDETKLDDPDYIKNLKIGLFYVLGDGAHTYTEIRDGKGSISSAKEYPTFSEDWIDVINNKVDIEDLNKSYIEEIIDFSKELETNKYYLAKITKPINIFLPKEIDNSIVNKLSIDIDISDTGMILNFGTNNFYNNNTITKAGLYTLNYSYNNFLENWVCEIKNIY